MDKTPQRIAVKTSSVKWRYTANEADVRLVEEESTDKLHYNDIGYNDIRFITIHTLCKNYYILL